MKKIILVDLGDKRRENNEPIGMESIASYARYNSNYSIDLQWLNIDANISNLVNYDIIGISLNIGNLDVFDSIYELVSDKIVILGGNIPTFAYIELLQKYENIICSIGEGEETFLHLVDYFDGNVRNTPLCDIPNIAFNIDGKVFETFRKPFNLGSAPMLDRNKRIIDFIKTTNGIARIEASRGCSWRGCSFCCVNAKYADPSWRGFSIKKIINELINLSNLGILSPYFTDEDFFGRQPSRVIALSEAIINLKSQGVINDKMDFFISILTNDIMDAEGRAALLSFKKAGLREVFIGIESIGREQLKRYNKKAASDDNKEAISYVRSLGLQLDLGFILFDPEMSFEELQINVEYIDLLKLSVHDSRSLKRLRIQPKTAYANRYISSLPLDVNNVEYPYTFKDERVNLAYNMYEEWENENKSKVWRFQALTRGENVSEREVLKQIMGKIRSADFEALKLILDYLAEKITTNTYIENINKLREKKLTVMNSFVLQKNRTTSKSARE